MASGKEISSASVLPTTQSIPWQPKEAIHCSGLLQLLITFNQPSTQSFEAIGPGLSVTPFSSCRKAMNLPTWGASFSKSQFENEASMVMHNHVSRPSALRSVAISATKLDNSLSDPESTSSQSITTPLALTFLRRFKRSMMNSFFSAAPACDKYSTPPGMRLLPSRFERTGINFIFAISETRSKFESASSVIPSSASVNDKYSGQRCVSNSLCFSSERKAASSHP